MGTKQMQNVLPAYSKSCSTAPDHSYPISVAPCLAAAVFAIGAQVVNPFRHDLIAVHLDTHQETALVVLDHLCIEGELV